MQAGAHICHDLTGMTSLQCDMFCDMNPTTEAN